MRTLHAASTALLATVLAMLAPACASPSADVLALLEAALAEKGAPAGAVIDLAAPDMALPDNPSIQSLAYNAQSGRFVARIGGGHAEIAVISGSARAAVETPVLIGPVARGETIAETNIAFEMRAATPDMISDATALIGTTARRNLDAGSPLRRSDVAPTVLVKKGAPVTVAYEAPGLSLSQAGAARANAVKGDIIEIETTPGGRVIRAVVTGVNAATIVRPPGK